LRWANYSSKGVLPRIYKVKKSQEEVLCSTVGTKGTKRERELRTTAICIHSIGVREFALKQSQ